MGEDLRGRTVVVTGGSGGIGEATVAEFLQRGANVASLGRTTQKRDTRHDSTFFETVCDVTDDTSVKVAFESVVHRFGPVDILVNNAGVGVYEPFLEASMDTWLHTYDVNVMGIVRCIRAVLPSMLERRWGRIINIASRQGIEGAPNASSYASSKAAVVNLGKCLEQELLSAGIHVSTIAPAGAKTDFGGTPAANKPDTLLAASDVARAVVFAATTHERAYLRELVLLPAAQ